MTDVMDSPAPAKPKTRKGALPRVTVLGAGPAGVGAALKLAKGELAEVQVLERQDRPGGNSSSFQIDGIWCDFGSHRLHPVTEAHVLADIKDAVGDDLLWRPRHGRILLQKKWIHFPLKPVDLIAKLPKAFAFSLMWDMATKPFRKQKAGEQTFATVLQRGLGPTISKNFYFPYVKKLWALDPADLAVTLANRRVSGSTPGKILMKVIGQIPGLKKKMTGGFFYPRKGFGEITDALHVRAKEAGAAFNFGAEVTAIEHEAGTVKAVRYKKDGKEIRLESDAVWSTLPISLLARIMEPPAPAAVLEAAAKTRYRGMILIYLILEQDQFTEYDAHYFPEIAVPMARMSEPKNYSAAVEPKGRTLLCAELPADPGDKYWSMSDDDLGAAMCQWLASVGLPVTAKVNRTETRRLGQAYPVYGKDFERDFRTVDAWVGGIDGLLTFGRQGLFAHDNTHHALAMAYAAVDCFSANGDFDHARWAEHRIEFESHVVED
ncbi:hypothetical protein BH11PSE2_BH11PSE2_09140 [soil metagenome]